MRVYRLCCHSNEVFTVQCYVAIELSYCAFISGKALSVFKLLRMETSQDRDWSPTGTETGLNVATTSTAKSCILHIQRPNQNKKSCQAVLTFTETQWKVVQHAAENRRNERTFEKSVYSSLVQLLPATPGENDGYHSTCYKNFTALASESAASADDGVTRAPHLRSATPEMSDETPSTSGIFSPNCLFCGNIKKRKKGVHELPGACETLEACQSIQEAAIIVDDSNILSKVSGVDLVAKEARYHHSCKSAFLMTASRISSSRKKQRASEETRVSSNSAVQDIYGYVKQYIILQKRPELLTSVFARYMDLCSVASETPLSGAQSLMRNLSTKFGQKLKCQTPLGKRLGIMVCNSETADDAIRTAYACDDEQTVTKAALLLRKQLLSVQKEDLPETPTLSDLKSGDVKPPGLLLTFFSILYSGHSPDKCSDHVIRRVKSACDDALSNVRRGKVKPLKHGALGEAMKSRTGSKKVIQMLNRFGHSLNYNCLEELETETAEQLQGRMLSCPDGTVQELPMGLAFQNLAIEAGISQTTQKTLHNFTASIHGAKDKSKATLNAFRYNVFEKGYGPKATAKNPLEKLKGINASVIPPCEAEVNTHMKRASFVAQMWANADITEIQQHPNGWDFDGRYHQPIWHEGDQMPQTLIPEEKELEEEESTEEDDMTVSSDDSDGYSEDED